MDNPRFYHYGGTLSHINLILTGSSPSEFNKNQITGGFQCQDFGLISTSISDLLAYYLTVD